MSWLIALNPIAKERGLTEATRYLLDANEHHGEGQKYSRVFFDKFLKSKCNISISESDIVSASSEWVMSNRRRLDILIVIRESWASKPKIVIGLEGKIAAKEGAEQISAYQQSLVESFPANTLKYLIYATPDGSSPNTENPKSTCKVISVSWREIAEEFSSQGDLGVDYCKYINLYIEKSTNRIGARQFLETELIESMKQSHGDIQLDWGHGNNELNFKFNGSNIIHDTDQRRPRFLAMLYCPGGPFLPGKQIHFMIMAHRPKGIWVKRDIDRVKRLRAILPANEGSETEWGPWKFVWSGGMMTLPGTEKKHAQDVADFFCGRLLVIKNELIERSKEVWGLS